MDRIHLENILLAPDFAERFLLDRDMHDEICALDPVIPRMDMRQYHPHHDYTVLMHTAHTVDGVLPDDISEEDFRLLRIAAFFHDCGKPDTMKPKTDSRGYTRCTFYGHPERSAQIAVRILGDMGYDSREIARISFMIKAHDLFLPLRSMEQVTRENVLARSARYLEKNPEYRADSGDFFALTTLIIADASAQSRVVYDPPRKELGLDEKGRVIREVPASPVIITPSGEKVREQILDSSADKMRRFRAVRDIFRSMKN